MQEPSLPATGYPPPPGGRVGCQKCSRRQLTPPHTWAQSARLLPLSRRCLEGIRKPPCHKPLPLHMQAVEYSRLTKLQETTHSSTHLGPWRLQGSCLYPAGRWRSKATATRATAGGCAGDVVHMRAVEYDRLTKLQGPTHSSSHLGPVCKAAACSVSRANATV
jgi:hypothetical protein